MSQKVSLNAYFERIGFAGSIAPTLATLELITALHPAAIPFENLSPFLGQPVLLDQPSLEKKLLSDRRGGYCFEHNMLLKRVLSELDFKVKALAGKGLWSDPDAVKELPDHMLLAVEIGGVTYICDAGYGGVTPTAPLRLRADVEQVTTHDTYRFTGGEPEWRLEVKQGEAWRPMCSFTTDDFPEAAFEPWNLAISAAFATELRVSLSPRGKRLKLHNTRLTIAPLDAPAEQQILTSLADLRTALSETFGITLPSAELLDPRLETLLEPAPAEEA